MKIIKVDQEKCVKCLECIAECPNRLFLETKNGSETTVQFEDPSSICIKCGHCLSICPSEAIVYQSAEKIIKITQKASDFKDLFPILKQLLQSKRSTRRYLPEPVQKADINKILDVMKYAPSASNARAWKFIVITDPNKIRELSQKIVKTLRLTRALIRNFIVKNFFLYGNLRKMAKDPATLIPLDRMIKDSQDGKDPIFFGAPCLVLLYSPKYGNLAGCDSGIISTYGMLTAETLGLGSCWIGVAQESLQRLRSISKFIGVPRGHIVWSCFTLGKPIPKFKRVPPRTDLSVKRIESYNIK